MRRPGRPKSPTPREMVVTFRLTQAEYRALQARALRQGRSVGELARQLVTTAHAPTSTSGEAPATGGVIGAGGGEPPAPAHSAATSSSSTPPPEKGLG